MKEKLLLTQPEAAETTLHLMERDDGISAM